MPEEFSDNVNELQEEISALNEELGKIRRRQHRLARKRTWIAGIAVGFASRVLAEPDLLGSIKAWRKAVRSDLPFPTPETDYLLAAVICTPQVPPECQ